jgi:hypothetical protein
MVSRLKKSFLPTLSLLMMSLILVACQDTIPQRGLITPDAAIGDTGGTTGGGSGDDKTARPDGAVKFRLNFCGCKDGKAVTYGNCNSFCSTKNTEGVGLLYANFNVTEEISLNSGLGNLYAWCNTPLPDEEANPRCVIKAKDEDGGEQILDVVGIAGSNSLTANIDKLSEDKAYVLTLVEQTSGAKSDSIQIVKFSADIPIPVLGPLKNAPISQYSCIHRPPAPDEETGDIYYDAAFRVHFYFLPRIPPQPIAAGSDIVCHDWLNPLYGVIDDILFPRLELIGGVFNLWDNTDPRFYDNNGNGNDDVNDIIIQKAKNFGLSSSFSAATKFFIPFPTMSTTDDNEEAGNNNSAQSLGYYMPPWTDQTTFRSYCLNSTHYNSSNPIFKAMRDVVGVDMEGIYVGVKAPETVFDRDNNPIQAPNDFLLIRETDLKKVWFYMKNNVPTVPTDAVVSSVPVFFYYPLNPASPYVKTSTQRIYQVKGAVELNTSNVQEGGNNAAGISTKYPPHDRKIGCIPKF